MPISQNFSKYSSILVIFIIAVLILPNQDIYRNELYGFQFRYDAHEFKVISSLVSEDSQLLPATSDSDRVMLMEKSGDEDEPAIIISVIRRTETRSSAFSPREKPLVTETEFAGKPALMADVSGLEYGGEPLYRIFEIPRGEYFIAIWQIENDEEIEDVLESFRFAK